MIRTSVMGLLLTTGCANKTATESPGDATPPGQPPAPGVGAEGPSLTSAECEAKGGRVVGDIGDGAIHRPDYTCEGGQPPIASIRPAEGEPVAIEGSVCCPAAA